MITTMTPILTEASHLLNEGTADVTSKRVAYGNRAMRRILRVRRWNWQKLPHTLVVSAGVQEYDLSSAITDYNPNWGIFEVYLGGEKIGPIDYNQKPNTTGDHFYLKPDGKTIGFTFTIAATSSIIIWYYPRWVNVADATIAFNISIPEDILGAVCLLIKSYVHGGKRQRYDERNALLDYKEEIEETVLQDASNKIKDLPQTVSPIRAYTRVRRTYSY